MRPVDRGEAPKKYTEYGQAIGDLEKRLGRYCSYCERRFEVGLAVEHVSPKSKDQKRELDWDNYLLACTNCNRAKWDTITNETDFVWPDKDNTMRAISYLDGGLVEPREDVGDAVKKKAKRLIELVGLDRHPGQAEKKQPAERDKRYSDREKVWALALRKRKALKRNDTEDLRETIAEVAEGFGFFGVWFSVFNDDPDMKRRFVESSELPGTARNCFDSSFECFPRKGGHC